MRLAKISALGDVDKTMDAVAAATLELLLCDIVCLFAAPRKHLRSHDPRW